MLRRVKSDKKSESAVVVNATKVGGHFKTCRKHERERLWKWSREYDAISNMRNAIIGGDVPFTFDATHGKDKRTTTYVEPDSQMFCN